MTTIKASYVVIPNESTPNSCLWLSSSDQVSPCAHFPTIYIYKENHNNGAIERMRDSLSKLLVHYYPLAGRLKWIGGGRLELNCNAKGVQLFEAESTKTMADYEDFSPNEPIKELIPIVDYTQQIEELPLMLVQLTRFHGSNEGLAIGITISHTLVDGSTAVRFINTWAKLSRGDTLDPDELLPFLDRTILKSPDPLLPPRFDHPEFKPFPLILGSSESTTELKKETNIALLKLTSEQVEKLKKITNDHSQKDMSRPYSRYEAIAAHIWRSISKARQLDKQQPTIVRVLANIHNRQNPPLPQNYFGNAITPTVTPMCHARDIISNPLSYAAQKIREAIDKLTNEYIRSQIDFIIGQEQLDRIRISEFVEGEHRDVPLVGNPNLDIVSWLSMAIYEADFGWGKPVYFGPGSLDTEGRVFIFLSPHGNGSIIIATCFQVAHMQLFKKFFYEDI